MKYFERSDQTSGRRGFTLPEVLGSLTILGLLLTLSIPAIQAARESARRSNCLSRLRQIGLATQQFEGISRRFPIAHFHADPLRDRESVDRGPMLEILPFLDRSSLSDVDRKLPGALSGTSAVAGIGQSIGGLLCPNHPESAVMQGAAIYYGGPPSQGTRVAVADYVFNGGTNRQLSTGQPPRADGIAIVVVGDLTRQRIDFHAVGGGLSNTLLGWESVGGCYLHTSPRAGVVIDPVELFPAREVAYGYYVGPAYIPLPMQNVATAKRYFFAWTGIRIGGITTDQRGIGLLARTNLYAGPASLHNDLWASVRCDGSVSMLSESIDAAVLLALASRD